MNWKTTLITACSLTLAACSPSTTGGVSEIDIEALKRAHPTTMADGENWTKTIRFVDDTGEAVDLSLSSIGARVEGGGYEGTFSLEGNLLCGHFTTGDKMCVEGEEMLHYTGDTTRYVASDGAEGTAVVIAHEYF